MFVLGDGANTVGTTDDSPTVLADVHLADGSYQEITAQGFELGLRALYPEYVLSFC